MIASPPGSAFIELGRVCGAYGHRISAVFSAQKFIHSACQEVCRHTLVKKAPQVRSKAVAETG
jgi:hypothetical protein